MPRLRARSRGGTILSIVLLTACVAERGLAQQSHLHFGTCDASAVVLVDEDHFLMATDEDNRLRLYKSGASRGPIKTFDLSEFLEVDPSEPEADIEAVTTLRDWTFWITSHGRSKNGKKRESRQRLFATRTVREGGEIRVEPVGKPYKRLLADLLQAADLASFGLVEAERRAPTEPNAINIEGLAAARDGKLWVAFRNPVPERRALLVPIENPRHVIEGSRAKLGAPALLDLGGLGVRSIEYVAERKSFVIVAGSATDGERFELYDWSGNSADVPRRLSVDLPRDFTPEALACHAGTSPLRLLVLSDDGERKHQGVDCKDLSDAEQMNFRSTVLRLD